MMSTHAPSTPAGSRWLAPLIVVTLALAGTVGYLLLRPDPAASTASPGVPSAPPPAVTPSAASKETPRPERQEEPRVTPAPTTRTPDEAPAISAPPPVVAAPARPVRPPKAAPRPARPAEPAAPAPSKPEVDLGI